MRTRLDGRTIVEEVHSWAGPLAADDERRLTRDKRSMNRLARRRLARRRKFLLERKKILTRRRTDAILKWDVDGDGWISRAELMQILLDLIPSSPPTEEDVAVLMATCAKRDARMASVAPGASSLDDVQPPRLTPAESLRALRRYEIAVSDVVSASGTVIGSIASSLGSLDDLDDFEELLEEERAESRARQLTGGSALDVSSPRTVPERMGPNGGDSRFCTLM